LIASIALCNSWAEVSVSTAEVMEKPKIDAPLMSSTEGVRIFCHRKICFPFHQNLVCFPSGLCEVHEEAEVFECVMFCLQGICEVEKYSGF